VRSVVVAEGIERPAELAVVLGLGVDAAQGYLLDRPSTDERDWHRWRHRDAPAPRPGTLGLLSARS
jgi:EAL domain-containing protein (putative c-di-GMP-specific phosphodiesterase class I)